jgi:hypothetical protein
MVAGSTLRSEPASAYWATFSHQVDVTLPGNVYDAPVSMLKPDVGNPFWFSTGGAGKSFKHQGPLTNPFATEIWEASSSVWMGPMPATEFNTEWRPWLTGIYKHGTGALLGLVHLEDQSDVAGVDDDEDFKMGLAYSEDDGQTFEYLGDILDERDVSDRGHNIKGGAYIIRNVAGINYFYVYFNDLVGGIDTTAVARAKVSDVMTAAANGTVTIAGQQLWKKYNDGTWTENGLGGLSSNLNTPGWIANPALPVPFPRPESWLNTHGDIVYSTHVGKYIWGTATERADSSGNGVALFFSSDGLNWTNRTVVYDTASATAVGSYAFFGSTFTGSDATAYEVGEAFHLYYAKGGTTLGSTLIDLETLTSLTADNFNSMTVGTDPTGWSVYESGGTVNVANVPTAFDKSIALVDTSASLGVSAVKSFAPPSAVVTLDLEFRLNDSGSRQAFRMKGNSQTLNAVHVYVVSGKLYWLDGGGSGHLIANIATSNKWNSLRILASATTDTYNVYLNGASTPATPPIPFENSVSNLDAIAFNTGAGLNETGDLWIDDLEVHKN